MPVAIDGAAFAVEIDRDLDVGFLGGPLHGCLAHRCACRALQAASRQFARLLSAALSGAAAIAASRVLT